MKHGKDERIPDLSGCVCTSFLAEQSWFKGRLQHRYNAFYLQVEGRGWHRFRVHCVGLYWKAVESPHHPETEGWQFRLTPVKNYAIAGRRIEKIDYWEDLTEQRLFEDLRVCLGAELRIHFVGNSRLEVRYCSDDLELRLVEGS